MPTAREKPKQQTAAQSTPTTARKKPKQQATVGGGAAAGGPARYNVPGDDVADEDLNFDFLDWSTCDRSRGLDVALSVCTRILAACYAADHLPREVFVESWARSGLIPFNPSRVLDTLVDDEEDRSLRRSGRHKAEDAGKRIAELSRQHANGEINVQQFLIACKETADDAVCYNVTESTGAAVRKGLGSGKLSKEQLDGGKKKRKVSKTDKRRQGMFQGNDYDAVAEGLDAEEAVLNEQKPWECKVVVKGKVCGWRLKKYLVKHADSAHSGVGNFYSHITKEEKKFLSGTALAASKDDAAAAAAAAGGDDAAAAGGGAAAAAGGDAAAAAGGDAAAAKKKRITCQICKSSYVAADIGKHLKKAVHVNAVREAGQQ
jgi:hypothetical protein